jgi:hypothetical protein
MRGAIPPLPSTLSWCRTQLKHRDTFTVLTWALVNHVDQLHFAPLSLTTALLVESQCNARQQKLEEKYDKIHKKNRRELTEITLLPILFHIFFLLSPVLFFLVLFCFSIFFPCLFVSFFKNGSQLGRTLPHRKVYVSVYTHTHTYIL